MRRLFSFREDDGKSKEVEPPGRAFSSWRQPPLEEGLSRTRLDDPGPGPFTAEQSESGEPLTQSERTGNSPYPPAPADPPSHSGAQVHQEIRRPLTSRCSNIACPLWSYYKPSLSGTDFAAKIPFLEQLGVLKAVSLDQQPTPNVYRPLAPWQTRLVELLPYEDEHGPPRVKLFCVDFADIKGVGITGTSEVVTYTALSHVWGTSIKQSLVICNGQEMPVARRLAEAIVFLAKATKEKYLWIDALYINQLDAAEKSIQVRNMLRIFEKADKVVAWIDNGRWLRSAPLLVEDLERCPKSGHGDHCVTAWDALLRDLHHLASDDLWTRTWCRQEVFAARKLTLRAPNSQVDEIDFDDFDQGLRRWLKSRRPETSSLRKRGLGPMKIPGVADMPACFTSMAACYQHAGTDRYSYNAPSAKIRYTIHWLRHLRDGTAFSVTDERDRVYGIFGMIASPTTRTYVENKPEIKHENFPISYDKTISEVYQDVVKFLINTDGNLDCLTVFEHRPIRFQPDDLPSWVTDWRVNRPRALLKKATGPDS